jgi:hypothetical protein
MASRPGVPNVPRRSVRPRVRPCIHFRSPLERELFPPSLTGQMPSSRHLLSGRCRRARPGPFKSRSTPQHTVASHMGGSVSRCRCGREVGGRGEGRVEPARVGTQSPDVRARDRLLCDSGCSADTRRSINPRGPASTASSATRTGRLLSTARRLTIDGQGLGTNRQSATLTTLAFRHVLRPLRSFGG